MCVLNYFVKQKKNSLTIKMRIKILTKIWVKNKNLHFFVRLLKALYIVLKIKTAISKLPVTGAKGVQFGHKHITVYWLYIFFIFRYANQFGVVQPDGSFKLYRDLYKAYGVRFLVTVQGTAGKFSIVPLLLNVASGLALLSVVRLLPQLQSLCIFMY